MRMIGWAAATAALATSGADAAKPKPVETIRYETSACFGFCPAYAVTVSSDGRGTFDGHGHTAVRGEQRFRVTLAQFAAFRAALAPVRPAGERLVEPGKPSCRGYATDSTTVDVRWSGGGGGGGAHLRFYTACDVPDQATLRGVLTPAPQALPIAAFIGARPAAR